MKTMIEHSASFKEKTRYSQEKYVKKKEKKLSVCVCMCGGVGELWSLSPCMGRYNPVFRVVRTTTLLLCELYFSQTPTKT